MTIITAGGPAVPPTVADVVTTLAARYPPAWAASWDRVGLVLGEPAAPVHRVLCVVDCVPETVAEAMSIGAQLIVAHHPLLLRPVSSVAPTTYKGRIVHQLIRNEVALYVAHTNADVADPGVSDSLADRLGLRQLRPLRPGAGDGEQPAPPGCGSGRIGVLPQPRTLADLTAHAAAVLPPTAWGVRAAGDPDQVVRTVAVCGGAGDAYLADAVAAQVDAYLTADLRHHPVSEHLAGGGPALLDAAHWATERPWLDALAAILRVTQEGGGPALLDAAHWATERPWLDALAAILRDTLGVDAVVSDLDTDPWTVHAKGAP